MTDDATLSDFGGETSEDDDSRAGSDADSGADDTTADSRGEQATASDADRQAAETAGTATERSDGAEPQAHTSLSTYAWGEYACSRCGADADRVWRDDGAFVCPDCKEW